MQVLFVGGTGLISSACSEQAVERGIELVILNRGRSDKHPVPRGAQLLVADIRGDPATLASLLRGHHFDAVVDWIAYTPADIEETSNSLAARPGSSCSSVPPAPTKSRPATT